MRARLIADRAGTARRLARTLALQGAYQTNRALRPADGRAGARSKAGEHSDTQPAAGQFEPGLAHEPARLVVLVSVNRPPKNAPEGS